MKPLALGLCCILLSAAPRDRITLSFPASAHAQPITGRFYVILTRANKPDPRIQVLAPEFSPPFFGIDAENVAPGQDVAIDASTRGYPSASIASLPAGDYYVEGLANIYTRYDRADGHTVLAHAQWDGQVFSLSPGNLRTQVEKIHLDPEAGISVHLQLDHVISQREIEDLLGGEGYSSDTPWIKHLRIQSPSLTKFWGTPIYLGATVLLPKGYASHPSAHYPVVYNQGHFYQPVPWDFTTDAKSETPQAAAEGKAAGVGTGYEFYQAWNSNRFPRFLMVTWQHPCPFFDDSYAVNSANCGPFGDAIMNELIPHVESRFRVLREPRARLLEGGSTGGWESLALQEQHPTFYGGAYVFDPDPVDFRAFQLVNLYADPNAFQTPQSDRWHLFERPWSRRPTGQVLCTERELSRYEEVIGSHGRSAYQLDGWWAIFDPPDADGYPLPMWNMQTGAIDRTVVSYARDHGYDLSYDLATRWPAIGRNLTGKLHFYVGDMDSYYLNLAVYRIQEVLSALKNPPARATFAYGRPIKGHGWHPMTWAALLEQMAKEVHRNAPPRESDGQWNY